MGDQPPPAPPLPPEQAASEPSNVKLKLREALQDFECQHLKFAKKMADKQRPPVGLYFLYGTLQDPRLLSEILDLKTPPVLQPAYVTGYHKKLWGQYPALVRGRQFEEVQGMAFEVPDEAAAARLAKYETDNYFAAKCVVYIIYEDGLEGELDGYTFRFCGDEKQLTEGEFDLEKWLKQVKRA